MEAQNSPFVDCFSSGSCLFSVSTFDLSESLSLYKTSLDGGSIAPSHRRKSYAILDAIFLKPILVPILFVAKFKKKHNNFL